MSDAGRQVLDLGDASVFIEPESDEEFRIRIGGYGQGEGRLATLSSRQARAFF